MPIALLCGVALAADEVLSAATAPPATPEVTLPVPPAPPFPAMPAAGAPPVFSPPVPTVGALDNGVPVWVVEDHVLPIVSVAITVPGGSGTDPAGQAGRATLSDQMMRQGAGGLSAEAFADLVEQQAIELDVSTGRESSTVTVTCQKDKLDEALSLVADMILRPAYGKADLERERSLEQAALEQARNDPATRAAQLAWAAWWGPGHPYATPPEGLPDQLGALTRKDVKAYHKAAWTSAGATITAAGDVSATELVAALDERLGRWKDRPAAEVDAPAPAAHEAGRLAADRPGSAQTTLYLMFRGEAFGAPGSAPLDLGSIVLGGTFTSRLNAKLREEKGYTYGARAATVELLDGGVVVVSTRVRADATGEALGDLLGELERAQQGITADELGKARGAWRQDLLQALETRTATVGAYAAPHRARLPPTAVKDRLAVVDAVDQAAVDAALKALAPGGDRVVVLVGDRATLEQELPAAGLPAPTWAD